MIAFIATFAALLALTGLAAWTLRKRNGCSCCSRQDEVSHG